MKNLPILLPLTSLLLLSLPVFSAEVKSVDNTTQESNEPETSPWKGDIQLGYVMSSGNTETTNLNAKVNLWYKKIDWQHMFSMEVFSSSDKDQTTAERYKIEYKADKKFTELSYLFIHTSYEEDRFSGYDFRSTLTAGYGLSIYDKNNMTLETEIGAGYRQSQLMVGPVSGNSVAEGEALLRLAANYLWQIEEDRSLIAKLTIESGKESSITNLELGFVTMIAGELSLKVSYVARHTTKVPLDKENLDTVLSINLLFAF